MDEADMELHMCVQGSVIIACSIWTDCAPHVRKTVGEKREA